MGKSTIVLLTILLASVSTEAQVINDIHISIHGTAEIILVDSLARRTGYDPIADVDYAEIPNASYGDEGVDSEDSTVSDLYFRGLGFQDATSGVYTLNDIGTTQGSFYVTISMSRGIENNRTFMFSGATSRASTSTFRIIYSTDTTVQLKVTQLH